MWAHKRKLAKAQLAFSHFAMKKIKIKLILIIPKLFISKKAQQKCLQQIWRNLDTTEASKAACQKKSLVYEKQISKLLFGNPQGEEKFIFPFDFYRVIQPNRKGKKDCKIFH